MADALGVDVGLLGDVRWPVSVTSCMPYQMRKQQHDASAELKLCDHQTSLSLCLCQDTTMRLQV